MPVTQADLLNLENKIKLDINTEQMEIRHDTAKKIELFFHKVDDVETTAAVHDNILKNMATNLEKLEKAVTNWFEKINNKIDSFPDKFATKQEHKENVSQIEKLSKALEGINLKIAMVSGGFAVFMFGIELVIQKMMK